MILSQLSLIFINPFVQYASTKQKKIIRSIKRCIALLDLYLYTTHESFKDPCLIGIADIYIATLAAVSQLVVISAI